MKKIVLFVFVIIGCLFISLQTFAEDIAFQNTKKVWTTTIGDNAEDYMLGWDLKTDSKGNIFSANTIDVNDDCNISVTKLDLNGKIIWQNTYGGSDYDSIECIVTTDDGGCIVGARSYSVDGDVSGNNGKCDYWIFRLNAEGEIMWQNSLGDGGCDFLGDIIITNDNNIAFTGMSYGYNGTYATYYKLSMDTGNVINLHTYAENCGDWVKGTGIAQIDDENFLIAGETDSYNDIFSGRSDEFGNNTVAWIAQINQQGDIIWQKFYSPDPVNGEYSVEISNFTKTISDNYLFEISTYSYEDSSYTRRIIQTDKSGNVIFNIVMPSWYSYVDDTFFAVGDYRTTKYYDSDGNFIGSIPTPSFFEGKSSNSLTYDEYSNRIISLDDNDSSVSISSYTSGTSCIMFSAKDKNGPIKNAKVTIAGTSYKTNSDGLFKINLKHNKNYNYNIEYAGYSLKSGKISLKNESVNINAVFYNPEINKATIQHSSDEYTFHVTIGDLRYDCELITALYNGDMLTGIERTALSQGDSDKTVSVKAPLSDNGKVFIWNGLNELFPLTRHADIIIEQ